MLRSRHAHDRADGAEDRFGPVEVVLGDVRAAGDRAHALSHQHRRVRHRTDHGDRDRQRRLDARGRQSGDDRQQARGAHRARHARDGLGVLGLHADHDAAGVVHVLDLERREDRDARESFAQHVTLFDRDLDDGQLDRWDTTSRPPGPRRGPSPFVRRPRLLV